MGSKLPANQEHGTWLQSIKTRLYSSHQLKAATAVNSALLEFYWQLGADIVEKQKTATWGTGFLQQLSNDLVAEFPDMKGFSYRNLRAIRQWYLFYFQDDPDWLQPVAKLYELTQSLPQEFQSDLPSIEDMERELLGSDND